MTSSGLELVASRRVNNAGSPRESVYDVDPGREDLAALRLELQLERDAALGRAGCGGEEQGGSQNSGNAADLSSNRCS